MLSKLLSDALHRTEQIKLFRDAASRMDMLIPSSKGRQRESLSHARSESLPRRRNLSTQII